MQKIFAFFFSHFLKNFVNICNSLDGIILESFEVILECLENTLQFIEPLLVLVSLLNQFVNYVFEFCSFPGVAPVEL